MTKAAEDVVDRISQPGFQYSKVEVLLYNLCQKGGYTKDLFSFSMPEATGKVMGGLDAINGREGGVRCIWRVSQPIWIREHGGR